jgi:asparaginyl-tRNA synthetase
MAHQYISELAQYEGKEVVLKGWVYNARFGANHAFIEMRDGSGFAPCVVSNDDVSEEVFEKAKKLTRESSFAITGIVSKDDRAKGGFEVLASNIEIYTYAKDYPIKVNENEHGVRHLADRRHLWLRSKRQWAIMRVRNEVIMGIHEFFQKDGFLQMDSPLFTSNAAEGSTDLFQTDFFGEPAYLAQTGQLYGEAMCMAQGKIYTFGPTFRAEKSDTPRHLAEFWMIEPEMAFYDNEMNMDLIEGFTRHVVNRCIKNCAQELEILERDTEKLGRVNQDYPRVPYTDAIKILRGEVDVNGKNAIKVQEADLAAATAGIEEKKADIAEREKAIKGGMKKGARKFNEAKIIALRSEIGVMEEACRNIPKWIISAQNFKDGEDFGSSDETILTRVFDAPVMVYNWPTKIKAFYMKEVEGDPDHVKGVDLLAPDGYGEIIGGSERETDIDVLLQKIKDHNLPMEPFEWYLDLRRFGSVPHSGFGLGLERMVRWVCGIHHLRETIPFPRRYGRLLP